MIISSLLDTSELAQLSAKNIGILGGSFDPPHLGHLELAESVSKTLNLDAVIFLPAWKNPLKDRSLVASNEQRLEMLDILIKDKASFFISDLEISQQKPSYTVDTLRQLHNIFNHQKKLYWIAGSDNLFDQNGISTSLRHWKDYQQILQLAEFISVTIRDFTMRQLEELDSLYPPCDVEHLKNNFLKLDFKYAELSSTILRAKLAKGDLPDPSELPEKLISYIEQHSLYRE